nr:hypothetical protein [Tanacetum cinerariifolium]
MDMPESSFEGLEVPPPNVKMAPLAAVIVEPTRERPADVLVQAEIHIAYGRTNQAAALLEEAIKEEPLPAAAAAAGVAAAAALAAEMDAKYVEDLLSDKDEPAPVVEADPAPEPAAQAPDD